MTHYYVAFAYWVPAGTNEPVSPHAWVDAETPDHAESLARRKLGAKVPSGLQMTTCVPFSEEDYQREMKRLSEYYKARGCDESGRNPNYN